MATPTTKAKAPRGPVKPRVLFMAYKGSLEGEPTFHFNKESLIDQMLEDRALQVKKITVPRGQRGKKADAAPAA